MNVLRHVHRWPQVNHFIGLGTALADPPVAELPLPRDQYFPGIRTSFRVHRCVVVVAQTIGGFPCKELFVAWWRRWRLTAEADPWNGWLSSLQVGASRLEGIEMVDSEYRIPGSVPVRDDTPDAGFGRRFMIDRRCDKSIRIGGSRAPADMQNVKPVVVVDLAIEEETRHWIHPCVRCLDRNR